MKSSKLLMGVCGAVAALSLATGVAYGKDHEGDNDEHKAVRGSNEHKADVDTGKVFKGEVLKGVARAVKLSNLGSGPLHDIEISFSGQDARDFSQTNDCGEKLAGNASCTINVWFAPKTPGTKWATMEIHTSGGEKSVPLSGAGV